MVRTQMNCWENEFVIMGRIVFSGAAKDKPEIDRAPVLQKTCLDGTLR